MIYRHTTARHTTARHTTARHATTRHFTTRHNFRGATRYAHANLMSENNTNETAETLHHDDGDRTIGQPSAECVRLCRLMRTMEVGQIITYAQIGACVGCTAKEIQTKRRSILYSARSILLRDDKMWFDCVIGEGYKRLNDREKTVMWPREARIIRQRATKAHDIVTSADFSTLSPIETRAALTGLSVMGAVKMFTKPKAQKTIESAIEADDNKELALKKTLSLFVKE